MLSLKMPESKKTKLEIVLKCDSIGSLEAVSGALLAITDDDTEISVIRLGIGAVNKSDILVAETGSRLILGFLVSTVPGLEKILKEHGVELLESTVIYRLVEEVRSIAKAMKTSPPQEEIVGSGSVIALFKSSRKAIIVGCQIEKGSMAVGKNFRIISAMGPVYSGTVVSLHIGEKTVQKAAAGQQVGIKISGFMGARVGDLVEVYHLGTQKDSWRPRPGIVRQS